MFRETQTRETNSSMEQAQTWSRRGFLSPRGLGTAAGGLFGAVLAEDRRAGVDERCSSGQWCVARRAMACEFNVYLPPTVPDPLGVGQAALDEIDRMEDLLTVYRQPSAMSYVNQYASEAPVRVDHRLYTLLKRAARLTEQTHGAFDAATGALIKEWGFFRGPQRLPSDAEREAALARSGMRHVRLDDRDQTVSYAVPGLEVNLGSIGKGYAIDRAMALLRDDFGVHGALIQGGLSSVVALGGPDGDPEGWWVGIQNPWDSSRRVAQLRLRDRALGTSGSANKFFEAGGRRFGHVLDPRSGWPADALASASAITPDGADADALATAFFVMGLDKTADFCHHHTQIGALLVLKPGPGASPDEPPRVVTFNVPREDVKLEPGTG